MSTALSYLDLSQVLLAAIIYDIVTWSTISVNIAALILKVSGAYQYFIESPLITRLVKVNLTHTYTYT